MITADYNQLQLPITITRDYQLRYAAIRWAITISRGPLINTPDLVTAENHATVISEIRGMNSIGKSVSVSFRVRVVCASGRARRSGVGAYGASASNAGGPVANILAGPPGLGGALLRRRKGFDFFDQKCTICKGFMQWDCSGCAGARVLRECNCESLEHVVGRKGFEAF